MRALLVLSLIRSVMTTENRCFDSCVFAHNGLCDTGSLTPRCTCGTDCGDCGVEVCEPVVRLDCGDGFRTCSKGDDRWCCDRSSNQNRCGDEFLECKRESNSANETVDTVVIAFSVMIALLLFASVFACCFLCEGWPGNHCLNRDPAPSPPHIAATVDKVPKAEGKQDSAA